MSHLFLKFMLNKDKTKVLFAEAGADFINILLSFLTLPLGKAVAILNKHHGEEEAPPAVGSLTTLRKGVSELDAAHFCVRGAKEMLLNPESSFRAECRKLAVDVAGAAAPLKYFLCSNVECLEYAYCNISMYSDVAKCGCGRWLNREIRVGECLDDADADADADAGGFVISPLFFVVADDLRVAPIVTGIVQVLAHFGINDTKGAEMRSLSLGINEICELLKLSLTSASPLTDFIIKNTMISSPQPGILLHHIQKHDAEESRKLVLKVCSQKSTNKFLFAEATDEFVELLLSFLTLPLGGVEFLLSSNTGLKNINNLYRSVTNFIDEKYFTSLDIKNRLINPKLAHGYVSKNQILLPLSEEAPPKLHYQGKWINNGNRYECSFHEREGALVSSFKSGKEDYVKKQTMFFVADDLTMNPSLAASILILNDLGVSLSDVKETELQIGLDEALGILMASLTSKTALADGLIKAMLRQPKKEG